MAIFYKKVQRGNPSNPAAPKLWYPLLRSVGMIKEKEVAKLLADETTLNPKEAEMSLFRRKQTGNDPFSDIVMTMAATWYCRVLRHSNVEGHDIVMSQGTT
jgi:hypothetical protein